MPKVAVTTRQKSQATRARASLQKQVAHPARRLDARRPHSPGPWTGGRCSSRIKEPSSQWRKWASYITILNGELLEGRHEMGFRERQPAQGKEPAQHMS